MTSFGATLPPPRSNGRGGEGGEGDGSPSASASSAVVAAKMASALFLLASAVAGVFYAAHFAKKWKKRRGQ